MRGSRCRVFVIPALAKAEAKPSGLVEEAERMYRDRQRAEGELKTLFSEETTELNVRSHLHNRRPYRDPNAQPVKWMKLIQWWLVHRVPIDMIITPTVEAVACARFEIPEWAARDFSYRIGKLPSSTVF